MSDPAYVASRGANGAPVLRPLKRGDGVKLIGKKSTARRAKCSRQRRESTLNDLESICRLESNLEPAYMFYRRIAWARLVNIALGTWVLSHHHSSDHSMEVVNRIADSAREVQWRTSRRDLEGFVGLSQS
ncbi:hypothetical protein PGT21_027473 [Puccinia graminis f. sp. tritici]|uniref:Uncharacterized protein n=1 Tax=Puccinia graminis f. sp. tritici TaxID=56615 RepID=A0A5B0MQ23_PUCGR|nr:hypothetical protein PGT21_027473 [Puccinia graminis f. sp. tritici]